MSFAARASDLISSPATSALPVPIIPTQFTVLIGGMPAARMTDGCGVDAVILGSMTVLIGGLPAARVGDVTVSGGAVLPPGQLTVLIGG